MLIKQRDRLFDIQPPAGLKFVYVEGKGMGLFADRDFKEGETVIDFPNTLVSTKDASTEAVQVDEDLWIDSEWLEPEAFINHSCNPNAKLDYTPDQETSRYATVKLISKDEEITFNYNATEWESDGFDCACGSSNCYKHVQGLKYLSPEQQEALKSQLLPYLLKRLEIK